MAMNLAVWVVGGVMAGWLTSNTPRGRTMGFALDALVGVIGALVGGLTMSLVAAKHFNIISFNPLALGPALISAALFLLISSLITTRRRDTAAY